MDDVTLSSIALLNVNVLIGKSIKMCAPSEEAGTIAVFTDAVGIRCEEQVLSCSNPTDQMGRLRHILEPFFG